MNRFFVNPYQVLDSLVEITDISDIKHISKVLRLKIDDEIILSDKAEWDYICSIETIDKELISAKILDKQKCSNEPDIRITLFQGMPKHGKLDLIVQKAVELGINDLVPVYMKRSVVKPTEKIGKKIERLNTIAAEAAKQCQRGRLPWVHGPVDFSKAINMLKEYDLVIFPYENNKDFTIRSYLEEKRNSGILDKENMSCAIIVGPEGGFADSEAQAITAMDIPSVTLGSTILRTETAGIVAIAMTIYGLELK